MCIRDSDHVVLAAPAAATRLAADDQLVGLRVDDGALVLVPAPAAVVVELDLRAGDGIIAAGERDVRRRARDHAAGAGRSNRSGRARRAAAPGRAGGASRATTSARARRPRR